MTIWKDFVKLISNHTLRELEKELSNLGFWEIDFVQESSQNIYLKAYYNLLKKPVGLKISKESVQRYEQIQREYEIVYGLNEKRNFEKQKNSNLVKSVQCCVVVQEQFVYSLEQEMQMLREQNQWFTKEQMCSIIIQLCIGISEIHKQRLMHSDIKTENIMKTWDGKYKLTDLGYSKLLQSHKEYTIYFLAFSQKFISPELAMKIESDQSIQITHKTDIYSLSLVILEVLNYNLTKLNALNILLNDFTPSQCSSNSSIEDYQRIFEFNDIYELLCQKFFCKDPIKRSDSYELLFNLLPLLPYTSNNVLQLNKFITDQNQENPLQNNRNIFYALNLKLYNSLIQIYLSEQSQSSELDLAELFKEAGKNYLEVGYLRESLELFLKALRLVQQKIGNSEQQAMLLQQISLVYDKSGQFELGLEYAHKSLDMIQNIYYQKDHESVAQCLHRVSTSYQMINNPNNTYFYAQKALLMRQAIYGQSNNESLADSLDQMSNSFYLCGDLNQALTYCQGSLDMIKQIYHSPHPKISLSHNNIGCIYFQLQDYDNSIKNFYRGLEIALQLYGQQHPIVQENMNNFIKVLGLLGRQEQAIKYQRDLQKIQSNFDLQSF